MKHINKNQAPQNFENWKRRNPNANWNDFSVTNEHSNLRECLISEQNQMCCYCEVRIENNGQSSHIEHLKDKSNFPTETFNYDNLLVSCQHNDSCGHYKKTNYFEGFVSPLDPNCQNRFTYTRDGRIIPINENDINATRTIDVLGLNCKRLKDRRKNIIRALEDVDQEYIQMSLTHFLDWFDGFYTVIEYMMLQC